MPAQAGRAGATRGEAEREPASDEAKGPRHDTVETANPHAALLHAAFPRENLQRAFKKVRANKGAAGVGGLDIDQTARHLATAWPALREPLLKGAYRPSPVRRVVIPKPDQDERELGIPTVVDRLIQQALLQILQPVLDPTFSEHNYRFRPGRRAWDAALAALARVQSGRRVVVDVDLVPDGNCRELLKMVERRAVYRSSAFRPVCSATRASMRGANVFSVMERERLVRPALASQRLVRAGLALDSPALFQQRGEN